MSRLSRLNSKYMWIGVVVATSVSIILGLSPLITWPMSMAIGWIMGRYAGLSR